MRMTPVVLLGLGAAACSAALPPVQGAASDGDQAATQQVRLLGDWAVARCLTKGFGLGTPAGVDAANSAAALLEQGHYGMDAYEAIERAVDRQLARPVTGSTGGTFTTLKCLELAHDPAFRALLAGLRPTPASK